jgi:hypothetical protein
MNDQKGRLWNTSKGGKSSERVVRKEIRSANNKQTKGVKSERERERERKHKQRRQGRKEERSANKQRSEEREREREKGSSGSTIERKREETKNLVFPK